MTNPFHHIGPFLGDQAVQRVTAIESVCKYLLRQEYVAILAPRQSGKTSFLAQLEAHLVEQGRKICRLDLEQIKEHRLLSLEFENAMKRECRNAPPEDLVEWLENEPGTIVFLIDELPNDVHAATLLLGSIRAYYSATKANNRDKGTMHLFVFAGSVDLAYLAIIDRSRVSPFNLAHEVYLPDFTLEETRSLIQTLVANENKTVVFDTPTIDLIYELTCGHPYLTQYLCYWIYDSPQDRDEILAGPEQAIRLCGIEDSINVQTMMARLRDKDAMRDERTYLRRILLGYQVKFLPSVRALKELQLQGCIKDQDGICAIRNRIYEAVFQRYFDAEDAFESAGGRGIEFGSRIRRFYGQVHIKILDLETTAHLAKSELDGSFILAWEHDYRLKVSLIEDEPGSEATGLVLSQPGARRIEVQGEDSGDFGVEYRLSPESFAVDFTPGDISQSFPSRKTGGPIRGDFEFRFSTPTLDEVNRGGTADSEVRRSFRIFLNLFQGIALVHVSELKCKIS